MTTEIKVQNWENELFGNLTTFSKEGSSKIFFIGKEVAEALGYIDTSQAIRKHCKGGVEMTLPSAGGQQLTKIIPESDVYRLVMRSKLPNAEMFQDWVMEVILPSIKKHEAYITDNKLKDLVKNPQLIVELAQELIKEKKRADYAEDKVSMLVHADMTFTVTAVAKEIGISAQELNKIMYVDKIQYMSDKKWVPYQKYQDKGLFSIKSVISEHTGKVHHSTRLTSEGRAFVINRYRNLNKL
jgi:prophage antirepressor-like protein